MVTQEVMVLLGQSQCHFLLEQSHFLLEQYHFLLGQPFAPQLIAQQDGL